MEACREEKNLFVKEVGDDEKEKNKKQQVLSESSYIDLVDGITTPHGPAAKDRTHPGGNFEGTCTQGSASTPATGHRSSATGHSPIETRRHRRPATGHMSTCHQSAVSTQINSSITGHRSSSHRSLNLEKQTPGRSKFTS